MIKENDTEQLVEVHYKDGMKDITDSLFRYEVRNDKITALESWVLVKVQVGLFLELAVIALIILLTVASGRSSAYTHLAGAGGWNKEPVR